MNKCKHGVILYGRRCLNCERDAVLDVEDWNKRNPIGTPVVVTMDNGTALITNTRSEAWLTGSKHAVVKVDRLSGGYLLSRVAVLKQSEPNKENV